MQIGPYPLAGNLVLAPMAGVTDSPYRRICRSLGASLTVGEMAASGAHLLSTEETLRRYTCDADDPVPVVQILGSSPEEMARAAVLAEECGAKIVDINFGCPARVVCGKACGSALMREPELAEAIMCAVVAAVSVPVTVKMRSGWDDANKNALQLALAAQRAGCAAVTVHGRTRAQRFAGEVNRADIAAVVRELEIPVIANGDVQCPEDAVRMLEETGASGVMIGRGAYGNPWVFSRTSAVLAGHVDPGMPQRDAAAETVLEHFAAHMAYWSRQADELSAVRSFRKHARWYMARFADKDDASDARLAAAVVQAGTPLQVRSVIEEFFG